MLDFTEIYDEQLSRVYGFIAYRVGNRADAEDLTQQTFERALRHWPEFDPRRAPPAAWLLAIARNLVIDHHRAGARGPSTVALGDTPEALLHGAPDVGADLGLSPELSTALDTLGDRERELLALRYGADLSGPEIARITGQTLDNVHQILSRTLRRLHELLEG